MWKIEIWLLECEISEMYVEFDDKTKINVFLEECSWKEMFGRIMKYNKDYENRAGIY